MRHISILAHKHTQWGHQAAGLLQATHCSSGVQESANDRPNCTESSQSEKEPASLYASPCAITNMSKRSSLMLHTPLHSNRVQHPQKTYARGTTERILLSPSWRQWPASFPGLEIIEINRVAPLEIYKLHLVKMSVKK